MAINLTGACCATFASQFNGLNPLVAAAGPNTGGALANVTLTLSDGATSTVSSNAAWGSSGATVTSKPVNYGGINEICDTRSAGAGVAANPCDSHGHISLSTGGTMNRTVTGAAGVPANAVAVTLHVTVTGTNAASFLTVWPTGQTRPTAAGLTWMAGQTTGNTVQATVGSGGQVSVFNFAGTADVIVDLTGYFSPAAGAQFTSTGRTRVCDTLPVSPSNQCNAPSGGGPLGANKTRVLNVVSAFGLPASTTAVVLNVTSLLPSSPSYLTIWPDGATRPVTSSLNWDANQVASNRVVVGWPHRARSTCTTPSAPPTW